MRPIIRLSLVLIIVSMLITGCGAAKPNGPREVKVTLTEFKIESTLTEFQVGVPYHFVVANNGSVAHEVLIAPAMMPGMTMDQLDAMRLAEIGEDQLTPGATAALDFTFTEPAELELSCHIPGHYEGGMKLPISVK